MTKEPKLPIQSPCEIAAKEVMPSIRASIAYILTNEMKLSKYEVAKLLGITPAAISNYIEKKRGGKFIDEILNDPENLNRVREAASLVLLARYDQRALASFQRITCMICSSINEAARAYGCHFLGLPIDRDLKH